MTDLAPSDDDGVAAPCEHLDTTRTLAQATSCPEDEKSPVSILFLSDGAQTRGLLQPLEGAKLAKEACFPVYTIALGTPKGVIERGRSAGSPARARSRSSRYRPIPRHCVRSRGRRAGSSRRRARPTPSRPRTRTSARGSAARRGERDHLAVRRDRRRAAPARDGSRRIRVAAPALIRPATIVNGTRPCRRDPPGASHPEGARRVGPDGRDGVTRSDHGTPPEIPTKPPRRPPSRRGAPARPPAVD